MSKVKTIFIGVGFLIPAAIVAALLTIFLVKIDYGPDPGLEIGLTLWGGWALLCGFYFKSKRFYYVGAGLLFVVFWGFLSHQV